jgi:hypothetical protein
MSDLVVNLLAFHARVLSEPEGDIFGDGKRVKEGGALEDDSEISADPVEAAFGQLRDVLPADKDAACVGPDKPDDVFEEDAFAATASANDDKGLTLADLKAQVIQNEVPVEAFG